ncbi:MAG: cation-translocating P-type ATPase [Ruminococcus sp.]|jgi:cation-transporting ATPase E
MIQLKKLQKEQPVQISRKPVERIQASPETGLTSAQVKERVQSGYANTPVDPPSKTIKEIILGNLLTYFNLVFAVIAVLLILVGSFRDLTFLPIIICNTLIGIIQEIRSKKTLDKLSVLNAPKANVIRDGKESVIPADQLVLDDLVIFQAGNQIPADASVVSGEVQVNESLITGESDEITKKSGESLLSGSFIVSGKCLARLDKVGADSYVSKLTLEAKAVKEGEQSEMIRSLNTLVLAVGIIIIPIGLMLVTQQLLFAKASLQTAITSMVAAVIGMIPEGLYLLSSVALAVSVVRLAGKKVLVHDMKCIETLARVNVLCVDKTGTITENTMQVNDMIPLSTYQENMETLPLELLLGDFVNAMSRDNITMAAMKNYFRENSGKTASSITSFSSAYKYSSATFDHTSYVIGAPEFVLRSSYEEHRDIIESYSSEGYRVLVFGKYHGTADGKELKEAVTPYCLVLLSNPIRKEARSTFQYFEEQGVDIKVISGDNPVTVSKVALEAGIKNAASYVDASTLSTDKEIADAVQKYTVFGRVTPNQKRQFVKALKAQGKTVAMTGDGVNDVLALKDADCSVAMASGSDAAAQASQLVLLESNFACMPSVVLEGRRVVNNLQRSGSLFLVKNIFSFLMALFSISFMIEYPLEPSQISLISMFTIGVPGFLLALEPNKNIIKGHFITNVLITALPAGVTDFLVVGALVVFGQVFGVDATDISTASTLLLAVVGFMILYRISKPMNALRWSVFIGVIIGILFCIFFVHDLFAISRVSLKCGMLLGVFTLVTEPVLRYTSIFIETVERTFSNMRQKRKDRKKRSGRRHIKVK